MAPEGSTRLVLAVAAYTAARPACPRLTHTDPTPTHTETEHTMCRAVRCKVCGKTTWAGCGQHVSQVMAGVPRDGRCPGHSKAERQSGGLLSRLLGRS